MRKGLAVFIAAAGFFQMSQAWAETSVCVDAGHGGTDSGATGCGLYEEQINLDVALRLEPMLKAAGFKVYMTRTKDTDVDLEARSTYANSVGATTFVSIHTNSAGQNGSNATGTEVFCYKGCLSNTTRNNYQQASRIQDQMLSAWHLNDRGVKEDTFWVLRKTSMPATLTELGFIGNCDIDAVYLGSEEHRQEAAEAHCRALVDKWGGDASKCTASSGSALKTGIVKGGTYKDTAPGEWLGGVKVSIGDQEVISSNTADDFWQLTVPEGMFKLTASKDGYTPVVRENCEPATASAPTWCSVALSQQSSVKGYAVGSILDSATGESIQAEVSVSGGSSVSYTGPEYWSFELASGTYQITATASGYTSKTVSCTVVSGESVDCSISLEPRNGTIVGKVYDSTTNVPVAATVSVGAETQEFDGTESYAFSVQAGTYTLVAHADHYEDGAASCRVNRGEVSTCNVVLTPESAGGQKGMLKGKLLDANTELPIVGTVQVSEDNVFHYSGTGQFQFYLAPGSYQVTGIAEGYDTQSVTCQTFSGQVSYCDIRLAPQKGTLTGYVYEAGNPMKRIPSTITVDGDSLNYNGTENWTKIVDAGTYQVDALTKYGETASVTCTAQPGRIRSCNIGIVVVTSETKFGNLSGVVARRGLENMLIPARVTLDGLATADYGAREGELWTFENLPVGSYRVSAESEGYYENSLTCTVTANETSRCNLLLTPIINEALPDPSNPSGENNSGQPSNPSNPSNPGNSENPDDPDEVEIPLPHQRSMSEDICSAQPLVPAHSNGMLWILGILAAFGFRRRLFQGGKR